MRSKASRVMSLTANLVASVPQVLEDAGPLPTAPAMTDEDYEFAVKATLAQRPRSALWVLAFGSLLWNPACDVAEVRGAVVQGWHRSFCFRAGRFRASPERPGLMLGLDRGGQCRGMVFRLADEQVEESLEKHFRRELVTKPAVYVPRWLTARTSEGPVQALAFVVDRRHERYVGRLPLDEVARMLATAAGPRESCAEYLHNTVAHLEELGIRDRNLWHLQKLVAERIAKAHRG
jgi:glutathione-specific gamma-glutamylcyclotransferase